VAGVGDGAKGDDGLEGEVAGGGEEGEGAAGGVAAEVDAFGVDGVLAGEEAGGGEDVVDFAVEGFLLAGVAAGAAEPGVHHDHVVFAVGLGRLVIRGIDVLPGIGVDAAGWKAAGDPEDGRVLMTFVIGLAEPGRHFSKGTGVFDFFEEGGLGDLDGVFVAGLGREPGRVALA
jgi:hypothetical protein